MFVWCFHSHNLTSDFRCCYSCEADPGALAKYVIALVKKDKSQDALRQSMVSQLEVFLEEETTPFVNQLFRTLDSQEYITPVIPNANPPNPNLKPELKPKEKEIKPIIPVSELANLTETINGSNTTKKEQTKKSDSEKEEKPPVRRRSRNRSRTRSRSRSWDNTRQRSREREHRSEREKRRSWRNKSPPVRRYERRRSRTPPSPRSRSRSPRHGGYRGNRYRNRSPPRSSSRSRSRSLDRWVFSHTYFNSFVLFVL